MIGPIIMRCGELIVSCNREMTEDDRLAFRAAAFGIATMVDPAGTAISTGIKVVRKLAKGD